MADIRELNKTLRASGEARKQVEKQLHQVDKEIRPVEETLSHLLKKREILKQQLERLRLEQEKVARRILEVSKGGR